MKYAVGRTIVGKEGIESFGKNHLCRERTAVDDWRESVSL
jgi:hypothetical protein